MDDDQRWEKRAPLNEKSRPERRPFPTFKF